MNIKNKARLDEMRLESFIRLSGGITAKPRLFCRFHRRAARKSRKANVTYEATRNKCGEIALYAACFTDIDMI